MPSNSKPHELEASDPAEMQQSLRLLDRSTSWFWWNTLVGLILLTAALVVLSAPEAHDAVLNAIHKAGIETDQAQIAMVPKNLMKLEGKSAQSMLKLSEALEEHDDVQNVYSNFDVDEKELEAMA